MPRPRNTQERRDQIVTGLLRVMAERGYEGASIQAIARAAGLTPGLVHYHFGSKQQILLQLVEQLHRQVVRRYETRAQDGTQSPPQSPPQTQRPPQRPPQSPKDPWIRLDAFIDAHLALDEDADPAAVACWVAVGAEALRQPAVREAYANAVRADIELLEGLVHAVLVAEDRPSAPAKTIATGLMAAIQGSYQLAIAANATPEGFAAPTIRAMARGLIGSQMLR